MVSIFFDLSKKCYIYIDTDSGENNLNVRIMKTIVMHFPKSAEQLFYRYFTFSMLYCSITEQSVINVFTLKRVHHRARPYIYICQFRFLRHTFSCLDYALIAMEQRKTSYHHLVSSILSYWFTQERCFTNIYRYQLRLLLTTYSCISCACIAMRL